MEATDRVIGPWVGDVWVYPADVITTDVTVGRWWWKKTYQWRLQVLAVDQSRVRMSLSDVQLVREHIPPVAA